LGGCCSGLAIEVAGDEGAAAIGLRIREDLRGWSGFLDAAGVQEDDTGRDLGDAFGARPLLHVHGGFDDVLQHRHVRP